jgi:acetyl esterase/lipase
MKANKLKAFILFFLMSTLTFPLAAQDVFELYPEDSIPNSKPHSMQEEVNNPGSGRAFVLKVSKPTLTVFLPDASRANGTAVIICPGGGYHGLAIEHEGYEVAKKFNEWGVTAFVLKYRIPSDEIMQDKTIGPLQDAQRAIQLVREKAKLWQINPKQVGIMGFSAGGHLAGSATVHFDQAFIANPLKTSLRPDFSILVYPVISFTDEYAHRGSREALLGREPDPAKVKFFTLENQVSRKTPPVFLVHAKDDRTVRIDNSQKLAEALSKAKVKHDLYVYEKGGHGFGLKNPTSDVEWMKYVYQWMFDQDLILKKR